MTATQDAAPEGDAEPNAIDAPGTAEEEWRSWRLLNELPIPDISGWSSVVVVAAHPDDEVLGVGGLLAMLAAARTRLRLVAITDGEASHPGMDRAAAGQLAERRAAETSTALGRLGAAAEIVRLRIPDTGVSRREPEVREALRELVSGFQICLAPWVGDLHADHEAAGRAARGACAAGTGLLSYPIWTWHWAHPRDPRVPWEAAARVPLSADATRRKRAAIGCFASQLRPRGPQRPPVLPPEVVAHFVRDQEVLIS